MGWIVIKVNRDPGEDRWCLWSSIAEGPVFDGTEEEMTDRYLFEYGNQMRLNLAQRIERAKVHGGGTDYLGANVTIPHKEAVLGLLDCLAGR